MRDKVLIFIGDIGMKIHEGDVLITAWAEKMDGTLMSRDPIMVLIQDKKGVLHIETIESNEQTYEMKLLYELANQANTSLVKEVRGLILTQWRNKR